MIPMTEPHTQRTSLKDEILHLQTTLADIHREKEEFFHKKEEAYQTIQTLVREIRSIKGKLDASRSVRDSLRHKRDEQNNKFKEVLASVRALSAEKTKLLGKLQIRGSPGKIKEHIAGKDIDEATFYMQNLPEIDRVEIKSWPFWAPTLPTVPDNIEFTIQSDEEATAQGLESSK